MRRWRKGTAGAVTMGTYHGLYCLGCCWPYFLMMMALGWMDILWMALFAGIIFGEKMWSRGIWVSRAAGVGLAIAGVIAMLGIVDVGQSATMGDQGMMPAMDMLEPMRGQMGDSAGVQEPAKDQMSEGRGM